MPDPMFLVSAVVLVAAIALALIVLRRPGRGTDLMPPGLATRPPEATLDRTPYPVDPSAPMPAAQGGRPPAQTPFGEDPAEVDRSGRLPSRFGPPTLAERGKSGADAELFDQLRHLKQRNRKIEAIRLLRARTGAGLKEAKDAVDRL